MIKRCCAILFLVLLAAVPLWSQTNKGSISGTVFDQSGAVLPGATVTIINIGTGHKIVIEPPTGERLPAPNLDPVEYRIEVDAARFQEGHDGSCQGRHRDPGHGESDHAGRRPVPMSSR